MAIPWQKWNLASLKEKKDKPEKKESKPKEEKFSLVNTFSAFWMDKTKSKIYDADEMPRGETEARSQFTHNTNEFAEYKQNERQMRKKRNEKQKHLYPHAIELEALSHQLKPFHAAWVTHWSVPIRLEEELPTQLEFFNFHVGGGSVLGAASNTGYFTLSPNEGNSNGSGGWTMSYFTLEGFGGDVISHDDLMSALPQSHTLMPMTNPLMVPTQAQSLSNSQTNIASSTHQHVNEITQQSKQLSVDANTMGLGNVSVELGSVGPDSGVGREKMIEKPKQREALRGKDEMFKQQQQTIIITQQNRFPSGDHDIAGAGDENNTSEGEEEEEEELDGRVHEEIVYDLAPIFPMSRVNSPISTTMSRVTARRLSRTLSINLGQIDKTEDGGESGANIVSEELEDDGPLVTPLSRVNTPLRAMTAVPHVTSSLSSRRLSMALLTATTEDGGESDANILSDDEPLLLFDIAPVATPLTMTNVPHSSLSARVISPLSTLLTATTEDGGESGANIVSDEEPGATSSTAIPIAIRANPNFVRASPLNAISARRLPRGFQAAKMTSNILASSPTADGGESDANLLSSDEDTLHHVITTPNLRRTSLTDNITTNMLAAAIAQDGGESDANIISTEEEENINNNNTIQASNLRSPNLSTSMQRVISPIAISSRRLSRALSANLLTATTEDGGESGANIVSEEDEQNSTPQVAPSSLHLAINAAPTTTISAALPPIHSIPLQSTPSGPSLPRGTLARDTSANLLTATTEDGGGESGGLVSIHEDDDEIDNRIFKLYANPKNEITLNMNASQHNPSSNVTASSSVPLLNSAQLTRPPSSTTHTLPSAAQSKTNIPQSAQPALSQKTNANSSLVQMAQKQQPNLSKQPERSVPRVPRIYVPEIASDVENAGTFIPAYSTTTSVIPPFPKRPIPYSLDERLMQQQMQRMNIQQTIDGRFYTTDPRCENLFKMIDCKETTGDVETPSTTELYLHYRNERLKREKLEKEAKLVEAELERERARERTEKVVMEEVEELLKQEELLEQQLSAVPSPQDSLVDPSSCLDAIRRSPSTSSFEIDDEKMKADLTKQLRDDESEMKLKEETIERDRIAKAEGEKERREQEAKRKQHLKDNALRRLELLVSTRNTFWNNIFEIPETPPVVPEIEPPKIEVLLVMEPELKSNVPEIVSILEPTTTASSTKSESEFSDPVPIEPEEDSLVAEVAIAELSDSHLLSSPRVESQPAPEPAIVSEPILADSLATEPPLESSSSEDSVEISTSGEDPVVSTLAPSDSATSHLSLSSQHNDDSASSAEDANGLPSITITEPADSSPPLARTSTDSTQLALLLSYLPSPSSTEHSYNVTPTSDDASSISTEEEVIDLVFPVKTRASPIENKLPRRSSLDEAYTSENSTDESLRLFLFPDMTDTYVYLL